MSLSSGWKFITEDVTDYLGIALHLVFVSENGTIAESFPRNSCGPER